MLPDLLLNAVEVVNNWGPNSVLNEVSVSIESFEALLSNRVVVVKGTSLRNLPGLDSC